uniref:ATPase8 protein n=1 Tax=Pupa strigosa TaxID=96460 RepID=Q9T9G1_9GAST|nr:ATP synthase F0 subunit 8 [Pupa strigosa]BAA89022.1 ATPase8 [Pupa strigosa]
MPQLSPTMWGMVIFLTVPTVLLLVSIAMYGNTSNKVISGHASKKNMIASRFYF